MSLRWAESGGQYHASVNNAQVPGLMAGSSTGQSASGFASRNGSTWGYGQNVAIITPQFSGAGWNGGVMGGAWYSPSGTANTLIMRVFDALGAEQCSVRTNAGGQLIFTRGGTQIGTAGPAFGTSAWHYLEWKFTISATVGTCELVVDGVTVTTQTGLNTQGGTGTKWFQAHWNAFNAGGAALMDLYLLDTDSGAPNNNYLGDVTVAEIYPIGAGLNAAWPVNQGSFALTGTGTLSSGVSLVYNGTIPNGASPTNAWQGYYFIVTGFANTHNNGTFLCIASTATTLTLANTDTLATGGVSGATATAAFQNPLQAGIVGGVVNGYKTTNNGQRPGVIGTSENQFLVSNTPNQKTDYAHQTLTLTGQIFGVIHRTFARKDDAGFRSYAQLCESTGTEETGATVSLSSSYVYNDDVLETDPHTAAAWTTSGFNAATFGVKEVA